MFIERTHIGVYAGEDPGLKGKFLRIQKHLWGSWWFRNVYSTQWVDNISEATPKSMLTDDVKLVGVNNIRYIEVDIITQIVKIYP